MQKQTKKIDKYVGDYTSKLISKINDSNEYIRYEASRGINFKDFMFVRENIGEIDHIIILNETVKKITETGDYDEYQFEVRKDNKSTDSYLSESYIRMSWTY